MKFVKFFLTAGEPITLSFDQAKRVMASKSNLAMISDSNGEWTGDTLNKACIVQTMRDRRAEQDWREKNQLKISIPKQSPEEAQAALDKMRQITSELKLKQI